jgi:hypothetical protein
LPEHWLQRHRSKPTAFGQARTPVIAEPLIQQLTKLMDQSVHAGIERRVSVTARLQPGDPIGDAAAVSIKLGRSFGQRQASLDDCDVHRQVSRENDTRTAATRAQNLSQINAKTPHCHRGKGKLYVNPEFMPSPLEISTIGLSCRRRLSV